MTAGVWNPTIEQGATWHRVLTYLDDGQPIDLTGYTARMDIVHKLSRKTALQLDTSAGGIVIDGVAGTITLQLSAVQTATLDTYQLRLEESPQHIPTCLQPDAPLRTAYPRIR